MIHLLFEQSLDAIYLASPDGTAIEANQSWLDLFGYDRSDLATLNAVDVYVNPSDRETFLRSITESGFVEDEIRFKRKDGTVFDCERRVVTLKDASGATIAFQGTHRDITVRKQLETRIRESEERFRALFDNSIHAIIIADATGRILEWNRTALELFGYTRDEAETVNTMDLYIDSAGREPALARLAATGFLTDEVRYRRKDGTEFDSRRTITALTDPTGAVTTYQITIADLTALRDAEAGERSQRVLAQALVETSPACILVFDHHRKVTYANAETRRVLGVPPDQVVGMTCGGDFKLLDTLCRPLPDDETPVCRVFKTEQPLYSTEYCLESPAGTRILSVSAAPVFDAGGSAVSVVAAIEDVTDSRRRERALRESEEKYRTLFEQSMDAVALVAVDGTVLEANPAFLRLFRVDSVEGMNASEFYHDPQQRQDFLARMQEHGYVVDDEHVLRRSDGTTMTCLWSAIARRDEAGRIVAFQTVLHDITAYKEAERALRESEEKYRTLFEQSMDAVALVSVDGTLLEANKAYLDLYGYGPEVVGTLNVIGHNVDPDERSRFLQRLDAQGSIVDEEVPRRRADGTIMTCLRSAVARRDENGRMVELQAVFRDITARKQMEQEREQSVQRLQSVLNATVEAMSAAVEMRDPYTAGHQRRVTILARAIAKKLGMAEASVLALDVAGRVHDLGKLSIPAEILTKPTRLTEIEYQLIRQHPLATYELLKGIDFPWPVATIALQHHERLDGSGYPHGLRGSDMLPEARVLAVADVFEAMSSYRPYRPALGPDAALEELQRNRGTLYDPDAVDACVRLIREDGLSLV